MPSSAAAIPAINGNPFLPHLRRSKPNRPLLFHRPRIVAVTAASNAAATSSTSYLTSVNDEIDAHLKQAIPIRPPLSVFEPMHHLTFAAPRTTAPALCIAACELVGGHRRQAMAAAAALRLMHAAALTRDHILSGRNRDRIGHSFRGMAQGERTHSHHGRSDHSELVCREKEAGIHGCAGAVGAILGGGTEEEIEKLRRYGLYVGSMQGVLSNWDDQRKEKVSMEKVLKELENLAHKELEGFERGNVQAISSLLGTNFGDA
uniref:Uncharacterized protein n=1 Tax=Salix viminalis TaxID=40686 RepID=A0A6N2LM52_SALVM